MKDSLFTKFSIITHDVARALLSTDVSHLDLADMKTEMNVLLSMGANVLARLITYNIDPSSYDACKEVVMNVLEKAMADPVNQPVKVECGQADQESKEGCQEGGEGSP